MSVTSPLLRPGMIGQVRLPNRVIRAATSESMANPAGEVTDEMVELHAALARGRVGLAFTGHMFVEPRGRYGDAQNGIHDDAMLPGLHRLTEAVHSAGGRVFAQLAHAGSQTECDDFEPIAPSPVDNVMTGRPVREAADEELTATVAAFGEAARRAREAEFDGVHLHAANGYLISEFRSPLTNRRTDRWGGDPAAREQFPLAVIGAVREQVSPEMGVTMKLGFQDFVPGEGLDPETAVNGAVGLAGAGLDAIEVSANLMTDYVSASIQPYIAVDRRRAAEDLLVHRLWKEPEPEAYFLPFARALRKHTDIPIVLVGGLRRTETMERLIESEETDFVSLARPLIREPDLVRQIEAGRTGLVDCVSCNICVMHEQRHGLRCWRTPRHRLFRHAFHRLTGRTVPA
ncbi:MAG: oxidase [Solirubrobacterales bacterium]|jgi:2,4-dienoyl-CoA reductase-like NADH-dependent reductase (Old Yellow Enzyme family)|nr:oxidase [Solirubrobacterales bacterium]